MRVQKETLEHTSNMKWKKHNQCTLPLLNAFTIELKLAPDVSIICRLALKGFNIFIS